MAMDSNDAFIVFRSQMIKDAKAKGKLIKPQMKKPPEGGFCVSWWPGSESTKGRAYLTLSPGCRLKRQIHNLTDRIFARPTLTGSQGLLPL
jgi:hypothetical protein